jgi:hypothetical protein
MGIGVLKRDGGYSIFVEERMSFTVGFGDVRAMV